MGLLQSRTFKTAMFAVLTILSSFIVGYGIAMITRGSFSAPLLALDTTATPDATQLPRRTAVLSANDSLESPEDSPPAPLALASAAPTNTSQPRSTATPAPERPLPTSAPSTSTPPPPTPLERFVSDSFDSTASGWLVRTSSRSSAGYVAGRYRLALSGQTDLGVSTAVQAEAYRLSADVAVAEGAAGLIFLAARPTTFYRLMISADGRYAVQMRQLDSGTVTNLIDWSESAALRRGPDAINRLQVERSGASVRCLANDQLLATLSLPDAPFSGQYGFALAEATGRGEASFDNLVGEYVSTQR